MNSATQVGLEAGSMGSALSIHRMALEEARIAIDRGDLGSASETLKIAAAVLERERRGSFRLAAATTASLASKVECMRGNFDAAASLSERSLAELREADEKISTPGLPSGKLFGLETAAVEVTQQWVATQIAAGNVEEISDRWTKHAVWLFDREIGTSAIAKLGALVRLAGDLKPLKAELESELLAFRGYQREPSDEVARFTELTTKLLNVFPGNPEFKPQRLIDVGLRAAALAAAETVLRGGDPSVYVDAHLRWQAHGSPSSDKEYGMVLHGLISAMHGSSPVTTEHFPKELQRKVEPILHQCVPHITELAISALEALARRGDKAGLKIVADWTSGFLASNFEAVNLDSGAALLYSADVLLQEMHAREAATKSKEAATVFANLDPRKGYPVVGVALTQLRMGMAFHLALLRVPETIAILADELKVGADPKVKDVLPSSVLLTLERNYDQFLLRAALDDQERQHATGHVRLGAMSSISRPEKRRTERALSKAERDQERMERLEFILSSKEVLGEAREAVKFEFDKVKARAEAAKILFAELFEKLQALKSEPELGKAPTRRLYESTADFKDRLTWSYRHSAGMLYSQSAQTLRRFSPSGFAEELAFVHDAFEGLKSREPEPPRRELPWYKVDPRKFTI